jgi:hypothetical protein
MKVFGTGVSTNPKSGALFFRGGDVYNATIIGPDAFHPPWPTAYTRYYMELPVLPFLCVKLGRFGFYAGWKCYGFDAPEYVNYPGVTASDIFSGSLCLTLTARFFTDG